MRNLSALLLIACLSAAGQTNVIRGGYTGSGGGAGASYTFNPPLSSNGSSVSLGSSGVSSGSYTCLNATINTFGLITTATSGTCGGGGAGTVTHTVGALSVNQLVFGNGAADVKVGDLTGDVTTAGSTATALATVNGTPGSFGSSSAIPVFTVDGKGRITAITTAAASGGAGGTGIVSGATLPATCTPGTDTLFLKTNATPNQQLYSCSGINTWTQNEVLGTSGALSIDPTTGALDIVTSVLPRTSAANTFSGRNGFTIQDFTLQAAPAAPGTGKLSLYANNDGTFHFINASGTDLALGSGAGGGAWGSITGTLSSQTDLQTALNAKQNTLTLPLSVANGGTGTASPSLVAGTNITVTGSWPNQTVNSSGGGSSTWNGITAPTANETLAMGNFTSTWTYGAATGAATPMLKIQDTLNNTGTGPILDVEQAAGSASGSPVKIGTSNTAGVALLYQACSTSACANFGTAGANYFPVGGAGGPGSAMIKSDNDILFMSANTGRWVVGSAGDFKAAADNTYNIGTAGAQRPANVYVAKKTVSSNLIGGVNTVTSSATPTFDLSLGDVQTMTLTANVTGVTLSNISAGQKVVFDFVQNATGGFTIAGLPAAIHGFTTIGTTASKHNVQEFYSPDGTNLYAVAAGSINQ